MRFVALLSTVAGLALLPAVAQAGVGAGTSITFPTTVTVGQTGLPASIALFNLNTPPNTLDTNSVCLAGEGSPPCAAPEAGITLVPACGQVAAGSCTVSGSDPGVFTVDSPATGQAGTSCAGMSFAVSVIDPATGKVRFTPQPVGTHVTLPASGSQCTINFTFSVIKSPTADQDPSTAGNQTAQTTEHTQWAGAFGPGALSNFARASSNGTTVLRAGPPTITTNASPDIPRGGQLTDQATVTQLVNPVTGATVTFRLYPPADAICAGTAVFTDTQVVTLNGTTATATSAAFTPPTAGVYRWIATYNGDANNLPIAGACNEATETRTVTGPPPPPPPPPPAIPCTPPPGPAPAGGVLCEKPPVVCTTPPGPAPSGGVLCARGTAAIRGRTGCQGTSFSVVVRGRQIQRVVFSLDGRVVRTLTRPNSGSNFTLRVNPRTLRTGTHRVIARTIFRSQSGTRPRVLRVTFSRCARRASAPAFTG